MWIHQPKQKEETVGKKLEETIQVEMAHGAEVESSVPTPKKDKKKARQVE